LAALFLREGLTNRDNCTVPTMALWLLGPFPIELVERAHFDTGTT
jgi:hypothetical protein